MNNDMNNNMNSNININMNNNINNNSFNNQVVSNKKNSCWLIIIIILIVLLGLGVGSYFVFFNKDDSSVKKEEVVDKQKDKEDQKEEIDKIDEDEEKSKSGVGSSDVNLSTDWKKYQFVFEGKTYSLPMSFSEFLNSTGLSIKDRDKNTELKSDYYALVNLYKDDKMVMSIEAYNDTDSVVNVMNTKLTRVSQSGYSVNNGQSPIIFPGGIKANQEITEDKLLELFGEPTKIEDYSSEDYISKKYVYSEDDTFMTFNNFVIELNNGSIYDIYIDHRSY